MLVTASVNRALDRILEGICAHLQLTPTMFQDVNAKYEAVTDWLGESGSLLESYKPNLYSQGSLRIDTTNRPVTGNEYDLDIVCELEVLLRPFPDPVTVYDLLWQRLGQHGAYRSMRQAMNRCVRLTYANQFHMDVLPAIHDPQLGGTAILVPDRELRSWKRSNPKGFAEWLEAQAIVLMKSATVMGADVEPLQTPQPVKHKKTLKRAVQLLKRARDIAFQSAPKLQPVSIVLTTLGAQSYRGDIDLFVALRVMVQQLVAQLPERGILRVFNPVNADELLSERWEKDPASYVAYAEWIKKLRDQLDSLTVTRMPKLAEALKHIFGDQPVAAAVKDVMATIEAARDEGGLQMMPSTGALSAVAAPAVCSGISVHRNTFYGSR